MAVKERPISAGRSKMTATPPPPPSLSWTMTAPRTGVPWRRASKKAMMPRSRGSPTALETAGAASK
jgi:hypothetical protein